MSRQGGGITDDGRDRGKTPFRLGDATIAVLHRAIRAGKSTVVAVVQRYLDRARAYNGPEFAKTEAGNCKRSERPQASI